jgi:hypothetical protein
VIAAFFVALVDIYAEDSATSCAPRTATHRSL